MPTQHSRFGKNFGPLLDAVGASASRADHLRVSDAERQAVADRLAQHYGDGRLDQAEFDERVGRAMSAKTRSDLAGLFDDLPGNDSGMWPAAEPAGAPGAPDRRARREMRRHHRHGFLTVALFVVVAIIAVQAVHWIFWLTMPLVWLAAIVLAALVATGHLGRRRTS